MTRRPKQVRGLWRSYISLITIASQKYNILRLHQKGSQMQTPFSTR
jgi:hypothetical protein